MIILQSQVIHFNGEQEYDSDSINVRLPQQPQQYASKSEQLTFISWTLKGGVAQTHPLQPIFLPSADPKDASYISCRALVITQIFKSNRKKKK